MTDNTSKIQSLRDAIQNGYGVFVNLEDGKALLAEIDALRHETKATSVADDEQDIKRTLQMALEFVRGMGGGDIPKYACLASDLAYAISHLDSPHETSCQLAGPWIPVTECVPEPEVLVLCWNGSKTFVEWFGSKPDAGRGVTHWIPYCMPPGAVSDMHDGRRALKTDGRSPIAKQDPLV